MNRASEIEINYTYYSEFNQKISNSKEAADIFRAAFNLSKIEHKEFMYAMYLNRRNFVLAVLKISEGGISGTLVDLRIVFQGAIKCNASGIILCHNHPSGELAPSQNDINFSKRAVEAGKILDLHILDSIIITRDAHYSLCDSGEL